MIPDTRQRSLFEAGIVEDGWKLESCISDFVNPDPELIFLGGTRLRDYLEARDSEWVIRLRTILQRLDLSGLRAVYHPSGRRPVDPIIVLGLILFGMIEGKWSLRELERLSNMDVRAWWICGGVTVDHSTIGKFILKHGGVFGGEVFERLTREVLKELHLGRTDVAGDGTVIEAVASRYGLLRQEAMREARQQSEAALAIDPDNEDAKNAVRDLQEAEAVLLARREKKELHGKSGEKTSVHPREPEACVQPLKNKTKRPAYKPSVLANELRIIVGQEVTSVNETEALPNMLDQHERIVGERVERLLLDAGYSNKKVFELAMAGDLDLLCPAGKADQDEWDKQGYEGKYHKQQFEYLERENIYRCPSGMALRLRESSIDARGATYEKYQCGDCIQCHQRSHCTTSQHGRTIKRYDVDQYKEVMQKVLQQSTAREKYRQRKAMVEPVFSELKLIQGLTRFSRRGLGKVRIEFALHCMAHNMRRAVRGRNASIVFYFSFEVTKARIFEKNRMTMMFWY